MKTFFSAFFLILLAAASLYSLEFLFLHTHPPFLVLKITLNFWVNFLICALVWGVVRFVRLLLRKKPGVISKKESELEEKLTYLSKIYQDLSNSLRLEKQKVESIISLAPDGIFTFGADGIVSSWNRSMENLTETTQEEAVGKLYGECLTFFSSTGQQLVDPFSSCLTDGKSISLLDCRVEVKEKNLPVALGAALVQQGTNRVEQIIVTVKDIRVQKEAERLKEDMMAMITHDLRSPLSAILGYAGLIQNPKLCRTDEDRKKYLESVARCGKGMLLLINNLLQTAGMEEGKLIVRKEPVNIRPILDEVAESLGVLAKGKNLSLVVEALDEAWAFTDREKLQEILVNLLTNAIKFSRPGEEVKVSAFPDDEKVKIAVSDSGPGISMEEKARLFEKFSTVRKHGSATGLGLYIVHMLAAALEGSVEVESSQGKGSIFTVVLPLYRRAPEPPRQMSLLGHWQGVEG